MTEKEYLKQSAGMMRTLDGIRAQINDLVSTHGRDDQHLVRPLVSRQKKIVDELLALDKEFFGDC